MFASGPCCCGPRQARRRDAPVSSGNFAGQTGTRHERHSGRKRASTAGGPTSGASSREIKRSGRGWEEMWDAIAAQDGNRSAEKKPGDPGSLRQRAPVLTQESGHLPAQGAADEGARSATPRRPEWKKKNRRGACGRTSDGSGRPRRSDFSAPWCFASCRRRRLLALVGRLRGVGRMAVARPTPPDGRALAVTQLAAFSAPAAPAPWRVSRGRPIAQPLAHVLGNDGEWRTPKRSLLPVGGIHVLAALVCGAHKPHGSRRIIDSAAVMRINPLALDPWPPPLLASAIAAHCLDGGRPGGTGECGAAGEVGRVGMAFLLSRRTTSAWPRRAPSAP